MHKSIFNLNFKLKILVLTVFFFFLTSFLLVLFYFLCHRTRDYLKSSSSIFLGPEELSQGKTLPPIYQMSQEKIHLTFVSLPGT